MDPAGTFLLACDSLHQCILIFEEISGDPFCARPNMDFVSGSHGVFDGDENRGDVSPSFGILSPPLGRFFSGFEAFVADSGNSRLATFR